MRFLRHAGQLISPDIGEILMKVLLQFYLLTVLSKYEYGLLAAGMLFFSYHTLGQLGTYDYLLVKLSEYVVKNDFDSAKNQMSLSLTVAMIFTVIGGAAYMLSIKFIQKGDITILYFFVIQSLLYEVYLYSITLLRNFYRVANVRNFKLVLMLLRYPGGFVGLYFMGVYGYLWTEILCFAFVLILFKDKLVWLRKFGKSEIWLMITRSRHFLLVGLAGLLALHLDRLVVLKKMDIELFADYSFLLYLLTAVSILPNKFLSLLIQYMRDYRISSDDHKNYDKSISGGFIVITSLVWIYSSVIFGFILPLILKMFLSEYVDLVSLLRISMYLVVFRFLTAYFIGVFNNEMKQKVLLKLRLFVSLFSGTVMFLFSTEVHHFLLVSLISEAALLVFLCIKRGYHINGSFQLILITMPFLFLGISLIASSTMIDLFLGLSLATLLLMRPRKTFLTDFKVIVTRSFDQY